MLQSSDLLNLTDMPAWADINLLLYKEFSEQYLIPSIFRYHLENKKILDVHFTEWGIYHILGIQHINGKISKTNFFQAIDNGLDFQNFIQNPKTKKRFNDFKHRIRMFGCTYHIMKSKNLFYVQNHQIPNTSIKTDYVKQALINQKGVNIGFRYIAGHYVAFTFLVDRSIDPTATIDKLIPLQILKLEIIRKNKLVEELAY